MAGEPLQNQSNLDLATQAPIGFDVPAPSETPVVLVDDEPAVLAALARLLRREGHPLRAFERAERALDALSGERAALLITDIRMPEMTGIELARRAIEEDPDLAVIVLTGAGDTDTAVESLRLGVQDYLTKPVESGALLDAVRRSLRMRAQRIYRRELERWVREEVRRGTNQVQGELDGMAPAVAGMLGAVIRAMEARDPQMRGHSDRVSEVSAEIARGVELGPSEVDEVRIAGALHDLGMVSVSDQVTRKEAKLTPEEWEQVRRHPEVGAELLKPLKQFTRVSQYVRYHHERLNGTGYPEGLSAESIPLGAQIVGLAEAFVSITEDRPFRPACSAVEALEILRGSEGVWYSRALLDALERTVRRRSAAGRG